MKAAVYHGPEDVRIEDVPDPGLEQNQDVVVEIDRTAICGSDLHLWHAPEAPEQPFVVGHEFLGRIVDVGSDVRRFEKGARVLVSCTAGCGQCRPCRRGDYAGCVTMTENMSRTNVFGFTPQLPGGQAEAVRVPFADTNCITVPDALDDEQALFITDILPTGFMAAEFAEVAAGDTVVVFGCGPVGTFAQMCAMARGAARVIAVDLDAGRLERAAQRGCIPCNPQDQNPVQFVLEATHGDGADCCIEAVGKPELITEAAMATRAGGRVSVVGVIMAPFEIAWPLFLAKNLTLRTGLVTPQTFADRLLAMIEQERIDPREIISHRLPLAEVADAYRLFAEHRDDVLKVVLEP